MCHCVTNQGMIMPIADSFISDITYIYGATGVFCLALLLVLPAGRWIARRLEGWPKRPMDNSERKAKWACKYYQATPVMPNTRPWPWLTKLKRK